MPNQRSQGSKTRTFNGCWTCRRRKVKCGLERPTCLRCQKGRHNCEGYALLLHWTKKGENETVIRGNAIKRKAMLAPRFPSWELEMHTVVEMLDRVDRPGADRVVGGPFTVFQVGDLRSDHEYTTITTSSSTSISTGKEMARSSPPKIHHDTLPQAISTSHPWPLAAELLHHYIMDVTGLLQPVIYTRNFYSIVYVPRALVGAGNLLLLGHAATPSSGDRSIFYSLLATSALHLRNTGAGLDLRGLEMDRVGRFCRAMAYRYLRSAMAEALSDQDALQTTMSAVLSLITIDVMDGGMSEFWVHLNAFKWLSRHQSRMQIQETTATSQTETYLNTIFYFQSTLSLTTDCTFIPVPWPADSQRSAQLRGALFQTPLLDDHCLQHTYGVTRKLVVFIRVIAVLFQSVSYYISCGLALPETLEQTLADLSNRLDAWDLNSERNLLHFDGSDESTPKPRVLRLHILAFSHAIRIFHLTHLVFPLYQGKEALQQSDNQLSEILQSHVSQVSSLLHMIEEIKRTSNNGSFEKQVAPILWPGFIASCEADSSNQESWAQWWNHMSAYRIGNIQSLRRIVEGVWRVRDESNIRIHGDLGGFFMPSWRALLVDEKRRILAL